VDARFFRLSAAAALLLMILALALKSRNAPSPTPTMSETPFELTAVPGKPGWLRSPVIDDNLQGDHEKVLEARTRVVQSYDPGRHHVFSGLMPDDDAQVPAGWEDAQRERLRADSEKSPYPIPSFVLDSVIFDYQPYRVFVAPREDTAEVIRLFRVGSHADDRDGYVDRVAAKVIAINEVAGFTIPGLSSAHVRLVFLDPISMETARELAALFPFMSDEVGLEDGFLGMEGYLSEMEADSGEDYLAECFFRDQEIRLWWD
jgi:hypothetical protein